MTITCYILLLINNNKSESMPHCQMIWYSTYHSISGLESHDGWSCSLAVFAETQDMSSNSLQHFQCLHSFLSNKASLFLEVLFFSILLWLWCSCCNAFGCSCVVIIICLPIIPTPLITASTSLHSQLGHVLFYICSTWWPAVYNVGFKVM